MIDVSEARLNPFQEFHSFHEELNVQIKVAHAAALLLVRHAGDPMGKDELADLITGSHPSWNAPPVRDLSIELQRRQDAAISAFALLAAFSAFDDFLVSVEADISRGTCAPLSGSCTATSGGEGGDDDEEEGQDRLFRLYERHSWNISGVKRMRELLRYFRLCRNCIAHRSSRVSIALASLSADKKLIEALKVLQEHPERGLKTFLQNEEMHIAPTLAILCSHVLRLIAVDVNSQMVATLGVDGVLRCAAYHAVSLARQIGASPGRLPEAAINGYLTGSRVRLESRVEVIRELKRIGIWAQYVSGLPSGAT